MTDNHNIGPNSGLAFARWGVDLRDAVRSVSAENALCEACVWEKLMDFDGVDDPAAALAQAVHFLNEDRRQSGERFGSFLEAVFGRAPDQEFEPVSTEDFFSTGGPINFGNLGDDSPFRTSRGLAGSISGASPWATEARPAFPTPGPIDDADKRNILRAAGYRVVMSEDQSVWLFVDPDLDVDVELLDGTFSGDLAWRAAWELFLQNEEVYRHYKGGVYIRGCDGKSSEDGSGIVVYEHVWPHEPEIWTRPKAEFDEPGRFVRMTT